MIKSSSASSPFLPTLGCSGAAKRPRIELSLHGNRETALPCEIPSDDDDDDDDEQENKAPVAPVKSLPTIEEKQQALDRHFKTVPERILAFVALYFEYFISALLYRNWTRLYLKTEISALLTADISALLKTAFLSTTSAMNTIKFPLWVLREGNLFKILCIDVMLSSDPEWMSRIIGKAAKRNTFLSFDDDGFKGFPMAKTKGSQIYAAIAPDDGKAYIGQTIQDGDKRAKQHSLGKKGVNSKMTQVRESLPLRWVTLVNLNSVPEAIRADLLRVIEYFKIALFDTCSDDRGFNVNPMDPRGAQPLILPPKPKKTAIKRGIPAHLLGPHLTNPKARNPSTWRERGLK